MDSVVLAIVFLAGGLILYAMMKSKTPVSDLVTYAQNAGFSGADAYTAAAIALAESGGNPNAYNKEAQDVPGEHNRESAEDGLGSYGLWQIYLAAHPEFQGVDLFDPQANANAAFLIYSKRGSFGDWSTFNNGKYASYLAQVTP